MEGIAAMIYLHGFLGSPSDLPNLISSALSLDALDWAKTLSSARQELEQVEHPLDLLADKLALHEAFLKQGGSRPWLLGYSMGGRIAMHLATRHPHLIAGAVIVSSSPGLASQTERAERLDCDQLWAHRFLTEDWQTVMRDWNRQSVFAADRLTAPSHAYDESIRAQWATVMDLGSVGRQRDLRQDLAKISRPVLFAAGELDPKYAQLSVECQNLNSSFRSQIIKNAGHRVPWSQPSLFLAAINSFINEVNC